MARVRRRTTDVNLGGYSVPAELLDPGHEVWQHRNLYWAFTSDHGLAVEAPPSERMGPGASPANRRNYASAAWGVLNGITDGPGSADWHQLRAAGLMGPTETDMTRRLVECRLRGDLLLTPAVPRANHFSAASPGRSVMEDGDVDVPIG
jgi:hypothetical protein